LRIYIDDDYLLKYRHHLLHPFIKDRTQPRHN